jgi:hypothetical protein
VLKKKFEDYVNPRKNTVFERYKFWECKQQKGETIDQFITVLKTRAKSYEFGDQTDSMILVRTVFWVSDIRLKERLLRESSELSLEKLQVCAERRKKVRNSSRNFGSKISK